MSDIFLGDKGVEVEIQRYEKVMEGVHGESSHGSYIRNSGSMLFNLSLPRNFNSFTLII